MLYKNDINGALWRVSPFLTAGLVICVYPGAFWKAGMIRKLSELAHLREIKDTDYV